MFSLSLNHPDLDSLFANDAEWLSLKASFAKAVSSTLTKEAVAEFGKLRHKTSFVGNSNACLEDEAMPVAMVA